jgi:16S rRNA (cytosine967-C5)-methyltransferase
MRIKEDVFADPDVDLAAALAGRYSMPRWLVARWLESAGERSTLARLRTGIGRPPLGLRARRERGDLYRALQEAGLTVRPGPVDTALLVEGGPESVALEHVARGDAWVQDASAQQVAPLVDPQPDERVLDLCAAPGGKTLHLADLMQRGTIVACDVAAEKLARLEALGDLVPDGVTLDVQQVPREGPLPLEAGSFDRILVDAPCTNTGVLRRRVEVRWRLDPEDIQALAEVQRDLLDRALVLLKPGGRLVYTTCSLESEENEETIASFLAAHPEVVREKSTEVPGGRDQDGGFAAVMRRGS